MLETKDLMSYSSLGNSSSYCSFKSLSNAREKRYRSLEAR
jgi:DNA-directed RNA polymerase subunit RPC12/RpoP